VAPIAEVNWDATGQSDQQWPVEETGSKNRLL
jgi:hypothetical protein